MFYTPGKIVKDEGGRYHVMTEPVDSYGYQPLATLDILNTREDLIKPVRLYLPGRQELKLIEETFADQIRAVNLGEQASPLQDFSRDFSFHRGSLSGELSDKIDGEPLQLQVWVQHRSVYDRSQRKAPSDESIEREVLELGEFSMRFLARSSGYNGLFGTSVHDMSFHTPEQVPQWGGPFDPHHLHARFAGGWVQGSAYNLK